MYRSGEEVHLDDEEARGGSMPKIVRYVLGISLALAIVAMSAVWITRAIYEGEGNGQAIPADQHALGG